MDATAFARLRELFDAAVALPREAQRAFIDVHAPEGDPVRGDLAAMLEQRDSRFLEAPVPPSAVADALVGSTPAIPDQVGPYRILKEVGRGGMGVVYQATRNDDVFRKVVALKIIGGPSERLELVEHFRRERQVLAGLDHPNIARILDGGSTADGRPFYVMEFVDGEPLHDYCVQHGIDGSERLRLIIQIARALSYLHHQSIVHRDIKPHNILVTRDGQPKLLDFGVAKALDAHPENGPQHLTRVVTPGYASPEQIGGARLDTRADIYSLGVVAYELLTGHLPFADAEGVPDLARQLSGESPIAPSRARADRPTSPLRRPGDLDRVLLKALQKDPGRRYRTMDAFADDLSAYLDGRPISARTHEWTHTFGLWIRRNPVLASVAALLMLAVIVGAALAVSGVRDRTTIAVQQTEIEQLTHLAERIRQWETTRPPASEAQRIDDVRAVSDLVSPQSLANLRTEPQGAARVTEVVQTVGQLLDRADATSRDLPRVQREVARGFRQVGDVEATPDGKGAVDSANAERSFKRASQIVARSRVVDPEWAERELAELSTRLARLGIRPDEVPSPRVEPSRRSVTPRDTTPPPTPVVAPRVPPTTAADPALTRDLELRAGFVRRDADATRTNLNALGNRLDAAQSQLRPDLEDLMRQIDAYLAQADKALSIYDLQAADANLTKAEYQLRNLHAVIGK